MTREKLYWLKCQKLAEISRAYFWNFFSIFPLLLAQSTRLRKAFASASWYIFAFWAYLWIVFWYIRVRWRDKKSSKNKNKHFEVNDSTANPNGLGMGNASNSCRTLLPFALASEHLENFNCFSSAFIWRNRLIMMKLEGAAPVFRWASASIPMTFLTAPQLHRKCFAVTKRARAEQLKIYSRNNCENDGNWFGESNIVGSRKKEISERFFLTFSCKSFFKRWRRSPHGDEDEERIFYAN